MNTKEKMTVMLVFTFGLSGCSPQSNDHGLEKASFEEARKFFSEAPIPPKPMFHEALDPDSSLTARIANSILLGEHPRTFWLSDKAPGVLIINGSGYEVSGMIIKPTGKDFLTITDSAIIGNGCTCSGPAIEIREGGAWEGEKEMH